MGAVTTLLIATRNAHKVGEIAAILGPGFRCLSLADAGDLPPVVEDAPTFAGNAVKKAETVARALSPRPPETSGRLFVLADDSGLEVDALGGAPGVHSARFAAPDAGTGGNSPDADNNAKLLRLLAGVPPARRTARFRCVLALVEVCDGRAGLPVGQDARPRVPTAPQLFEGACEGRIDFAPRGAGGFGYDPLFIPLGQEQSFAELGEDVKNGLSHRANALAKLRAWFGRPAAR